jgi:dTDP-4-amino-4,6-dideoxy-D-galactose acyltransferase
MTTESISRLAEAVSCTPAACEILDWDSKFFGVRIARVIGHRMDPQKIAEVLRAVREESIQCVYFLAGTEPASTRIAERNGFHLVDVRLTMAARLLTSHGGMWQGDDVREVDAADMPAIREISTRSHTDSRFHRDGRFPRELCDELYRIWITRNCHGCADVVLVAEHESLPAGYVSCHLKGDGRGEIGLMGVDENARSSGLGGKLVRHALRWFQEREVQDVTVVTEGTNIAALRLYQQCGFTATAMQLWFHYWHEFRDKENGAC